MQIDDIDKYQAYVFEKEAPTTTIDIDKINCKDGFHIIYPFICTKPILQHILRACIIDDFNKNKYFDDINPTNNLDDIFDKAVIERNGWMMYGSNKPNCFKYKLTNVYDNNINIINLDDDDLIELIQTVSIHKFNNEEITKYNSNFDDNKIETMFEKIYPKYSKKGLKGTEDEIRIAHILINLLKVERVNQYNTWIEIGFCLHNKIPYAVVHTMTMKKVILGDCKQPSKKSGLPKRNLKQEVKQEIIKRYDLDLKTNDNVTDSIAIGLTYLKEGEVLK